MKDNKNKGFTLIEIIVCVIILGLVGTVSFVGINNIQQNNLIKESKKVTHDLKNALEVYISLNPEIEENLILNTKAAIVTLETLKNEGLIEENLVNPNTGEEFDYKKSYFTLLEGETGETPTPVESYDCNLSLVGIEVINSWDLNNYDVNDVIYICPRKDYAADINALRSSVDDISSELDEVKEQVAGIGTGGIGGANTGSNKDNLKINSLFDELTYTAKGTNPNNWVEFKVSSNTSELAYFPNNADKNLWRIVSINPDGIIKLVYSQPVISNNSLNYTTTSSDWCDPWYKTEEEKKTNCRFYKLKHSTEGDNYYKYRSDDGFTATEVTEDVTAGSKKEALYNAIQNKTWIITSEYFPTYNCDNNGSNVTLVNSTRVNLKMGMLSSNEINSSINISDSWLFDYDTILGSFNKNISFDTYYLMAKANSGNYSQSNRKKMANRCTSNSCNKDRDSSDHWHLYTYNYHPVIALNNKVELDIPTCAEGIKTGSKECPYKLTCTDC